jgi:hypothetical protein
LSLRVWPIFSCVLPCFRLCLPGSVPAYFQSISVFLTSECALLLSDFPFLYLKRLVCAKLFAKLGCCRTLCSFLSGQVVNYSQLSLTMLLNKLTSSAVKPLTRPEEVLPMGPHSATDGGPPCLSLVPYPGRATG